MKQWSKNRQFFLFLLLTGLLAAACAQEAQPPLQTGKIIAQGGTTESALDITYSVGRFEEQLNVVGTISNTNLTDLDFFNLDLTVTTPEGKVAAQAPTVKVDIPDNDERTFSFILPLLHGPHLFQYSYEYDYYDYTDNDLIEPRVPRLKHHGTGSFEDRIELP